MDAALHTRRPAGPSRSALTAAACTSAAEVLAGLGSGPAGLTAAEAVRRQATYGPNAVATHRARLGPVLWQQLRSPLLGLLVAAATASYFVGERTDALIIGTIVALSVGLGLANEYRAEKAAEALHSRITHRAVAVRSGQFTPVNATNLVPSPCCRTTPGGGTPRRDRSGCGCRTRAGRGRRGPAQLTVRVYMRSSPAGRRGACGGTGPAARPSRRISWGQPASRSSSRSCWRRPGSSSGWLR